MKNEELEALRLKINSIDDEILQLLSNRSEIVLQIGKHKNEEKVVDLDREQKVLDRLLAKSKGLYSKDTIVRLWREIFQSSEKLQKITDSHIQSKRSIENINIYKGGKSTLDTGKKIIKLSSNENPYGPSPKIIEVLNNENLRRNLHRYPEIDGSTLRKAIAKKHSLQEERIILGSGSDEVLLFAALAFCQDGDEILHATHGFEMYSIVSKVVGAVPKKIIEDLISSGYKFNGKSLPARGVMLINSLDLSKSFMPKVFEQNFSPKVGNYVPGTDIYIDKDENINGDNLIIWSWHVVDEIIYYLKKIGFKGSIWKPLPRFEKVVEIS